MKIYFIGIGGIGMSALARYYLAQGFSVIGSDLGENEITKDLKKAGAEIIIGQKKENIKRLILAEKNEKVNFSGTDEAQKSEVAGEQSATEKPALAGEKQSGVDLVVYSAAVKKNNPELVEAKKNNLKCQTYAQALGDLTKGKFTIAISGMHGKSTTTAMIGLVLEAAGLDPTVIVGTRVREWKNSNYRAGKSNYLVIEADEYNASFLNYQPKIIVLLNIEEDHLDFYKGGIKQIVDTFGTYVGLLSAGESEGTLIGNSLDENIIKIAKKTKSKVVLFPLEEDPDLKLKIPGSHNIANANAVLALAKELNIDKSIAVKTLNNFTGTWRRMEYKGSMNGAKIYDDYAHHPTEIKAALAGARELVKKNNRLWCVFQPHQYQRTYKLFKNFTEAFNGADQTVILPIYSVAGRENESIKKKVSSAKLVRSIKDETVIYLDSFDKAEKYLKKNLKKGDVCLIMGAGSIYKLTEQLI